MDDDNSKISPRSGRRGGPSASTTGPPGAAEAGSTGDPGRSTSLAPDERSNGSERVPDTTYSKQVRVATGSEPGSGEAALGTWDPAPLAVPGTDPTDSPSLVVGSDEDFDLAFEDLAAQ